MKPLIVGEANPYGADPRYALWPYPSGASGARLCRVMGLTPESYLNAFERVNLFPESWGGARAARERACAIIRDVGRGCVLVLLGTKVRDAFNLKTTPTPGSIRGADLAAVVLPHPSGLNRAWNEPGMVRRCREVLCEAIPGVPFGEVS